VSSTFSNIYVKNAHEVNEMDDYDTVLKKLVKTSPKHENKSGIAPGRSCVSDELFTEYLENVLDPIRREQLEEHLCSCDLCRKRSIMLHETRTILKEESLQRTPVALTNRAKQLVGTPTKASPIEIIIGVFKDTLEIIRNTASIIQPLQPVMVPVRFSEEDMRPSFKKEAAPSDEDSNKQPQLNPIDTVFFRTDFAEVSLNITVESAGDKKCQLEINTSDISSGKAANNIRLTLLSGGRELTSQLTVNGHTSFGRLIPGKYTLEAKRKTEVLGNMLITLEAV
jgi:hypothetical protein